jgi:hypothetical protein
MTSVSCNRRNQDRAQQPLAFRSRLPIEQRLSSTYESTSNQKTVEKLTMMGVRGRLNKIG